jgi:lysophospholipase L1-like esterase
MKTAPETGAAQSKRRRLVFSIIFILLMLASIEAASQMAYRIYKGSWYLHDRRASGMRMLQLHPYFGAALIPNISEERNGIRISHNSFRCRGPEFARPKPPGRIRVVALGGSTTYGAGVSDNETWEYFLGGNLGTNFEVINMGGPGGTSVETLIQSELLFSDVQPDIALYYMGWNDAQVQHVKNLWPDWSDSHGKLMTSQAINTTLLEERTATGYFIKRILFHLYFPRMDGYIVLGDLKGTPDALTDHVDQRALGLYERNLHNLAAICRKQGVRPVFIPQILNYDVLTSDKPYGWLPFVRDRDLKAMMTAYNETLAKVAKEENVPFLGEVLEQHYGASDFVDNGHFSAAGDKRFAEVIARNLARIQSTAEPSSPR